ncbi:MAG: DUF5719 family protein [Actinomycetota bacterium]|nr:DUF5719 family protein [Actinomycetota bacterium]
MAVTEGMRKTAPAMVAAFVFFAAVSAVLSISTGMNAAAASGQEPRPRLMVAWEEGKAGVERLLSAAGRTGGSVKVLEETPGLYECLRDAAWPVPGLQSVPLRGGLSLEDAKRAVAALPGVRFVEEDAVARAEYLPDDPQYERQWYLARTAAPAAWDAGSYGEGVLVAVVDSGVDAAHPDLRGRVERGFDFVDDDEDTADPYGHGTHVAGIIAAAGDNGEGVAGMAWRARILPVRVLDGSGYGYYSDIVAGIRYAADRGARVINLSLGGGASSRALQEAVDYASSRGCLLVAAAGNGGLDSLSYPAACEGVLGVGATDSEDRPASFSNRGEGLDLVAPGVAIYATYTGGRYASLSGTSMAAPQVSGTLALMLSREPGLDVGEAEARLTGSARDLCERGWDAASGWGILRVDGALGLSPKQSDGPDDGLYFAEGYTGPGFDTYLLLENPGGEPEEATLELFGNEGLISSTRVSVPARSRLTLHLNRMAPAGDVSARLVTRKGSALRAQRSMYFDYHGIRDGHTTGASGVSREWYFAEGYTGPGFDTYILVLNPQKETAHLDLDLMTPGGCVRYAAEVAPGTRRTIRLNDLLPGAELATAISSDLPVVAERAVYFDMGDRSGGSAAMGARAAAEEWYFAEGYTGGDFDTWLLLANPSPSPVTAIASFQRGDGVILEREVSLQPRSRATLHVDEIPGLGDVEVSARVRADYPGVVAERAMYFAYRGSFGMAGGGHAAMGATESFSQWLIPEGYTGPGFESWVLVSNLEDKGVVVQVVLMGESGREVTREYALAPRARLSVLANDLLAGEGVSAEVTAAGGERLVVEGAFYFRYGEGIDGGSS